MYLLATTSDPLRLMRFHGQVPEYVILSHTWGEEEEEVSFQELQNGTGKSKAGYQKIKNCCKQAASDGFRFAWIDTCCIDKTSSAELSEAINSMYQWYKDSRICYAYLEDVDGVQDGAQFLPVLGMPKWFTRGWTLQELIAPSVVEFYSKDWTEIGTKLSLAETITSLTGIPPDALQGGNISRFNFAEKMSWASRRSTTREEDKAYCLMGLFNINMPLLYGEGSRAFIRLQEEILKRSEDYTMFAWADFGFYSKSGLLASSPSAFDPESYPYSDFRSITELQDIAGQAPIMSSRGVHITLPVQEHNDPETGPYYIAHLSSLRSNGELVCIMLSKIDGKSSRVERSDPASLVHVAAEERYKFIPTDLCVVQQHDESWIPVWNQFGITCNFFPNRLTATKVWPSEGTLGALGSRQIFKSDPERTDQLFGAILCEWNKGQQRVQFLVPFGSSGNSRELRCGIITELPASDIDTWSMESVANFSERQMHSDNRVGGELKDRVLATVFTQGQPIQVAVRIKRAPSMHFSVMEYALHISLSGITEAE